MPHARSLAPLALAAALVLPACKSDGMTDAQRLEIYVETAYVHWEQGDLDRAQSQALKGLAIDRRNRPLNLMMGWILLRRDRRDDLLRAEQVFERLLEQRDDPRARQGLASAHERLAALHAEAADKVAAGEVPPERGTAEERARELDRQAGELYARAYDEYMEVLAALPGYIKAQNGAMRTAAALGDYEASLARAAELIDSLEKQRAYWTSVLQREQLEPREEKGLRRDVADAVQVLVETHFLAATLCERTGRPADALAHLDRLLELDPRLPETYSLRAQVLHGAGRTDEALADLDRFISQSDKTWEHPDIRRALDLRTDWTLGPRD